jgi:hypothetical protein
VSFAAITFCVASQRVFIVVVHFVIDSVRKLLDTPSYAKKLVYLLQSNSYCWLQYQYSIILFSFVSSFVSFYQMGAGGSFRSDKTAMAETDHSPSSSAMVKNVWSYTSTPPYVSWHGT